MRRRTFRALLVALMVGCLDILQGGSPHAQLPGQLPGVEPLHDSGQDVTPAFEGWFKNPDGSVNLNLGYWNRNLKEAIDIPIGPENKIEPGGPDQGQPTHFLARRGWGVFTVTVPKDFGSKKLTWTLTSNGRTNAIPLTLDARWEVDALKEATVGNTPPVISFKQGGATGQGPHPLVLSPVTATVGTPLPLDVWGKDDNKNKSRNYRGAPFTFTWSVYRGSAPVTFAKPKPDIEEGTGHAATTATFTQPGTYWLRVVTNDSSGDGGGGFQCCWTNGLVKVTAK